MFKLNKVFKERIKAQGKISIKDITKNRTKKVFIEYIKT